MVDRVQFGVQRFKISCQFCCYLILCEQRARTKEFVCKCFHSKKVHWCLSLLHPSLHYKHWTLCAGVTS